MLPVVIFLTNWKASVGLCPLAPCLVRSKLLAFYSQTCRHPYRLLCQHVSVLQVSK
uniref:SWIM-type domain-containing protein n=1 Tax=Mesocestoides corti TaxID=53468 RepID=A0A5K3FND6_MESCO